MNLIKYSHNKIDNRSYTRIIFVIPLKVKQMPLPLGKCRLYYLEQSHHGCPATQMM